MSASAFQDMPPPGGYSPITFKRIPARTYFRGWHWFVGYIASQVCAFYVFHQYKKRDRYIRVENQSAYHAIQPLMLSEMDRGFLRQLIRNREEEERVMKNVPGWEVGTYYGEPIFKTISKDEWVKPIHSEYFAHNTLKQIINYAHFHYWH